jgi:hypothetical protein
MKFKSLLTLLIAGGTSFAAHAQQAVPKPVSEAMNAASADQLKADITYLADDKLLGRQPGTPGFQMAADYVIGRLKAYNVQPAGDNGSWLQRMILRRAYPKPGAQLSISGQDGDLIADRAAAIYPNPVLQQVTVDAPLAFAGYGITNAEQKYDDYKGLDVKGKVVVIVRGAPAGFPSSEAAHSRDLITIQKTAAAHGAIGVLLAQTDSAARIPNLSRGIYSAADSKGNIVVSGSYYSNQIKLLGTVGYRALNNLLVKAGKQIPAVVEAIKGGQPQSLPLNAQVKASYESAYTDIAGFNVVGKITGSDPKLKDEYVVHSAHLDHLGVGRPVEGDSIYNGAHDNASGVSSLLQIANVYSHLKAKPKRSILIVMVTGEELGELGSGYFAKRPTVPVKNIVADVNTDMPTIIAPLLSVTALGAEHSSLQNQVNEAATDLGLSVEPDPEPKENRFVRSDQYSFVVQGIPALHIKYGSKTADGKNNLNEMVGQWRAKYYHKPQDDINGMFDFNAGRTYAQLNFLIGYLVANNPQKPTWNPGDIFEVK